MKRFIFILIIILIITAPLSLLGYLIFKNYYFPNGFYAVYDFKKESKYISPLKPLSAVGEIVDTWNPGTAKTPFGGVIKIETREIFQPVIDDFVYTDVFVPFSLTKKFKKLNLTLLYRADTPELRVCLRIIPNRDSIVSKNQISNENGDWLCQIFNTEKQMDNWFNLNASWDIANAYEIKPRHYRIGIFAPGLNEKKGILHIKKIEIEAK